VDIGSADECWEWTGAKNPKGYGQMHTSQISPLIQAHRLSWELDNKQEIPEGMLVCHSCDNPGCVNPAHLFLGTSSDNAQDAVRKGRQHLPRVGGRARGSKNGNSKLTEADVYEIRRALWTGAKQCRIAVSFGVTPDCISQIKCGRNWGWLAWEVEIETG
jgi:hypothetical protein